MATVTGILPHVAHMWQINNVKEACEEIKTEVRVMRVDLKTIIHEAIDEKVEASGGINTWYFIFMVKYGQFPEMVRGPQAYINNFHRS